MGTQALNQQPETGPGSPHSDGRLLEHFVKHHDERAFAELVTRHGPYILGVCRRVTAHPQDAEDVFQACFLELVRKAGSILQHDSVAGWLQTVAVRLGAGPGRDACGSRKRRRQAAASEAVADVANLSWREVRQVLEEEMARLPDELRSAVVVCLFEGRTQEEAGRILNVNPRTLKDRLRRGRELLRGRLSRRGITLAVMGTLLSGGEVEASVPAALETATHKGAAAVVHKTTLAGTVSPSALTLACSTGLSAGGVIIAAAVFVVCSIGGYVVWGRAGTRPMQSIKESFRGGRFNHCAPQLVRPHAGEIHPARTGRAADHAPVARWPGTAAGDRGYALPSTATSSWRRRSSSCTSPGPRTDRAAGLTVYFFMDDGEWNGLWFGKMNEGGRGPAFVTGHNTGDRSRGEERITKFTDAVAASDGSGIFRLRVVRRGNTIRLFAADGAAGELRHMQTLEVSGEDVRIVRFAADPGWSPNAIVDGRLVELTMKAEEFVGYPAHGR